MIYLGGKLYVLHNMGRNTRESGFSKDSSPSHIEVGVEERGLRAAVFGENYFGFGITDSLARLAAKFIKSGSDSDTVGLVDLCKEANGPEVFHGASIVTLGDKTEKGGITVSRQAWVEAWKKDVVALASPSDSSLILNFVFQKSSIFKKAIIFMEKIIFKVLKELAMVVVARILDSIESSNDSSH
ncbi:hypothetical protein FXO37_19296 [Capsicum annuum]|nr:hypothetical protein FXO37_19296 [Capsicum annuum]